jgi:hypothetical protein
MKHLSRFVASISLICGSLAFGTAAQAEIIAIDGKPVLRDDSQPKPGRGMTMQAVEAQFGTPAQKRGAVGQPPITRWDYPGFSVYFEYERVVHAVSLAA